jgi:hypothetical protein
LLDKRSSPGFTSITEEVIQVTLQMYKPVETGMVNNTIQWGNDMVEGSTEYDVLTQLHLMKVYLKGGADKHW